MQYTGCGEWVTCDVQPHLSGVDDCDNKTSVHADLRVHTIPYHSGTVTYIASPYRVSHCHTRVTLVFFPHHTLVSLGCGPFAVYYT